MLIISSCAELQLQLNETPPEKPQASAELSYLNGDFTRALEEFTSTYHTTSSIEERNGALYGLACTKMMLAQTDDEFLEAITFLQRWNANKGTETFHENRNLLLLALKQQSERIKTEKQALIEHDKHQQDIINIQKNKISQMANTLKKLKKQLDELEAIDEIFQEKRKP